MGGARDSSRPSGARWIWCIEYAAKVKKDLRCIHELMSAAPAECRVDLGKRTNEVVALRILEFMFNPNNKHSDGIDVVSASGPMIEFDSSLRSIDVLKVILNEIPLAELRPGMSELSKFNALPFIAQKNNCLSRCAFERLRDATLEDDQRNAAPSVQARESALRDEQPIQVDEQSSQAGEEVMETDPETMHMKDAENQRNAASSVQARESALRDKQLIQVDEQLSQAGEEAMETDQETMHMKDAENQRNAAPSVQARESALRDEQPIQVDEQLSQAGEEAMETDQETMHMKDAENQRNGASSVQGRESALRDEQPIQVDEQLSQAGEEAVKTDEETVHMKDAENQRNAASFVKASEPVLSDEQARQIAVGINEEAHMIEPMPVNEQVEVVVTAGDVRNDEGVQEVTFELTNSGSSDSSSGRRHGDGRVRCDKDGTWLICGSRGVSDTSENPLSRSRGRQDTVCVKCGEGGTLLVCSTPECAAKVHEECLNGPAWLDDNQKFHCPECRYQQVASEHLEFEKSLQAAKKKLFAFNRKLSAINKKHKG